MRDLFDEFLDELRRRQAEAAAANPEGAAPADGTPAGDDAAKADDDASDGEAAGAESDKDAGTTPDDAAADDGEPTDDGDADGHDDHKPDEQESDPEERRRAFEPVGGRGGGRRPPRPRIVVGGPNDGSSTGGRVRNFGIGVVGLAIIVVIILLGVGVSFLTDAIWFKSVGFESVFWTRVTTQVGLFAGGGILALVFLLFNFWLAGRLLPPPDPDRPSPFAGWFERIAGEDVSGGGRPGRPWKTGRRTARVAIGWASGPQRGSS